MKEIKIALLGIGRIGRIHFRNINQYFPNATVVAVADPQYTENEFRKSFGNAFFTTDAEEAITRPGVDAVLGRRPSTG